MFRAGAGDDTVVGGRFSDSISGGGGADTITLGRGDMVSGGDGDDTFIVDRSGDYQASSLSGDAGFDVLLLDTDQAERNMIFDGARIGAVEKIEFVSAGRAVFIGSAPGISELEGSEGANTLLITSTGTVNLSTLAVVDWEAPDKIKIVGSSETNTLTGSAAADIVIGGDGADRLAGGGGDDILQGLGGPDLFVFDAADGSGGVDFIRDFSADEDRIGFDVSRFDALAKGALQTSAFKDLGVAGASVDNDDRIIYDSRTGELFYDADGGGGAEAVMIATLKGTPALSADDIVGL